MTFENIEKTGAIQVTKATVGSLNLEGIEFILSGTSDSGRAIELKATTNENGIANFTGVPIGTYVVKENGDTVPTAYLRTVRQGASILFSVVETKSAIAVFLGVLIQSAKPTSAFLCAVG